MLIIALVLAAIGLAALVFAVVTSNALVAWVCIGASLLGVLLLIVDALRERRRRGAGSADAPEPVSEAGAAAAVTDSDDVDAVDAGEALGDGVRAESSDTAEAVDAAAEEDFDGDPAAESVERNAEQPAAHPAD